MIFVDASVLTAAVGDAGPEREDAQRFFVDSLQSETPLVSSALVLQQVGSRLLNVGRMDRLDAVLTLARGRLRVIWPLEEQDVLEAYRLQMRYPGLSAQGLVTLLTCRRRGVDAIHTYDPMLRHAARCGRQGTENEPWRWRR